MTRWKKDAKVFSVSLNKSKNRDGSQSTVCRIPKPIMDMLGDPNRAKFLVKGSQIHLVAE